MLTELTIKVITADDPEMAKERITTALWAAAYDVSEITDEQFHNAADPCDPVDQPPVNSL